MMTTGDAVSAEEARRTGLVDEIIAADLVSGAVEFAKALIARGGGVRRVREMTVRSDGDVLRLLDETRSKLARTMRGQPAPLAIVDCCEAAVTRPFDEARAFERESFLRLLQTTESKALRHAFFAERQAAKIPDVPPETPTRAIDQVAVVGAGLMGCGIAMSLANAGLSVALIDTHTDALDRGLSSIRANYAAAVAKGRLTQDEMDRRIGHIQPSATLDAASDADVIIEAVFERMDVKQQIFRALDTIAKRGAILATNTSTLDIEAIADATTRPHDVVGMHFFSPANVMRLLEVVRCSKTADDVLATAMQLGKRLGKVAVVSGVCDGFIGNRMLQKYAQQSLFLLDEGCTPQQVDRAMTDWGMAMGPFAVGDLAGLDIGWAIRKRRRSEGSSMVYSAVADRICEAGRLGQKTGKGWYRYEAGSRTPIADPETDRIIDAYRKEIGIAPRAITSEEIVERMVYALVNEGAAILDEGIALRASDIDIVYLTGYGFPAHRGGPMFHADSVGPDTVTAAIERCSKGYHGDQWTLSPLLARLAATGRKFNN